MERKKQIFNSATYEKVNKKNKDLLEDYILEMKSKKKSEGTIKQYVADIKAFYCWLYDNMDNTYILKLKRRAFRNFFLFMDEDRGLSSSRINRFQCSLRNLLEFASEDEDEYDYPTNVMAKIKGLPKITVRDIPFLTDEQIHIIFDYLMERKEYMKALYLMLSYESGARRNEVHQVTKYSFLQDNVNLTNEVIGKRAKKFRLIYFDKTREVARLYLEVRGNDDIDSLWVDSNGEIISYDKFYTWCLEFRDILEDKIGEYIALSPHTYRHSLAENLKNGTHHIARKLGKKFDIMEIQKVLNHNDLTTTKNYLKPDDDWILLEMFNM